MADAGRILIMPKGNYNPSVSYEMLDLVFHNDVSWIAKKPVIGVEPSDANADYWFKMVDNSGLQNIINGTTPVGKANNADTVDGWHIINNPSELGFTAPFTMTQLCEKLSDKQRFVWVNTSTANNGATDVPNTYGLLIAEKRNTWCYATWIQVNKSSKSPLYAGSWHPTSGWTGWSSGGDADSVGGASLPDIQGWVGANYLPLSGGKLTGDLYIKKSNYPSEVRIINYNGEAFFRNFVDDNNYKEVTLTADGSLMHRVKTNGTSKTNTVLHTGNMKSHVLPLYGGTLTSSGADTLVINRTTAEKSSWVTFNNNGVFRGRLGVSDDCKARVVLGTGNEEEILHTGNSAKVVVSETAPTDTSALWVW